MTFEQWWNQNVERLWNAHCKTDRVALKRNMAQCWDAALDAALESEEAYDDVSHVSGVLVQANDIEMLKVSPTEVAQIIHEHRGKS